MQIYYNKALVIIAKINPLGYMKIRSLKSCGKQVI